MESTFSKVEELAETIKAYINNRITATKLIIADKVAAIISNLIAALFVVLIFIIIIIFASIALALWLGVIMNASWLGFLSVAIIYLVIAITIWIGRIKFIRLPLINMFLKQLFESDEKD